MCIIFAILLEASISSLAEMRQQINLISLVEPLANLRIDNASSVQGTKNGTNHDYDQIRVTSRIDAVLHTFVKITHIDERESKRDG